MLKRIRWRLARRNRKDAWRSPVRYRWPAPERRIDRYHFTDCATEPMDASILQRASPRKRPPAPGLRDSALSVSPDATRGLQAPDVSAGFRTRGRGSCDPPNPRGFPEIYLQCQIRVSFPLTAAGQFRIRTGFPFNPASFNQYGCGSGHRRDTSYCVRLIRSTEYFAVWGLQLRIVTGRGRLRFAIF